MINQPYDKSALTSFRGWWNGVC